MSLTDETYLTGLAEYIDKKLDRWKKQRKERLETKWNANFNAVTNHEYREKMWKKGEATDWRSDTWIGYVRVKVWSFYAILSDMILQAGRVPFELTPSPYENPPLNEVELEEQQARIDRMKDKIKHNHTVRNSDREYMKKWLSLGYYGLAFSKFDVEEVKGNVFKKVDMGLGENAAEYLSPEEIAQYTRYEMTEEVEDVPGHRYVSVWNMLWDLEGTDLQKSDGYSEIIHSSPFDLRTLQGQPGYIDRMIERVIDRNKDKSEDSEDEGMKSPGMRAIREKKKNIPRYEFYMRVPVKLAEEFEEYIQTELGEDNVEEITHLSNLEFEDVENDGHEVEIMGEFADKNIIRYIRNDTGRRPHKLCVLEQDLDESTGRGISDNMESVQGSLIGMIRAFEDNKKLSANVTTAIKKRFFQEPGQLDTVKPGTQLDIADSCDDVRKAILPIVYPDAGESLMSGISLMMQLKDDVSMIPTIMQGFVLPKQKTDTAFEMDKLMENAGKYIGMAVKNNDEMFIEPETQDEYEHIMLYDPDESCKISCRIKANGFTAYQNKVVRGRQFQQLLSVLLINEYILPEIKLKAHLEPIYRSMNEDPDKFLKSEDEKAIEQKQKAEMEAQEVMKALEMEAKKKQIDFKMEAATQKLEHEQKLDEQAQEHLHEFEETEQEHRHTMTETEQEHVHDMELETLKARVAPQPMMGAYQR